MEGTPSNNPVNFTTSALGYEETTLLTDVDDFIQMIETGKNWFPQLFSTEHCLQTAAAIYGLNQAQVDAFAQEVTNELLEAATEYDNQHESTQKHTRPNQTALQNWDVLFGFKIDKTDFVDRKTLNSEIKEHTQIDTKMHGSITSDEMRQLLESLAAQISLSDCVCTVDIVTAHFRETTNDGVTVNCAGYREDFPEYDTLAYIRDIDLKNHLPEGIYGLQPEILRSVFVDYFLRKVEVIQSLQHASPTDGNNQALSMFRKMFMHPYVHHLYEYTQLHGDNGVTPATDLNIQQNLLMKTDEEIIDEFDPYFGGKIPENQLPASKHPVRQESREGNVDTDFVSIDIN